MLHKDRHGKINLPYSFLSTAKLELMMSGPSGTDHNGELGRSVGTSLLYAAEGEGSENFDRKLQIM